MAWFDFLNAANARGRDAGSIARQRLAARAAIPAARAASTAANIRLGMGFTPQGFLLNAGAIAAPYVAEAAGNYLRSPQGVLLKDRLSQGDIPGAFTALTGLGRQQSPLRQYNPPGFDPSKPVTSGDLRRSASAVSPLFTGGGPGSPAAERAYQTEKSRVAQLTAQDPELQRYENARKAAVAPGATPEQVQSAEDIGMQIWAKKYGKLAEKVKPGQSGYEAIQRLQGTGSMGSPLNLPFDTSSPLGTTPPVSPASYESGQVAQGLGLSALPGNAFAGASAAPYAAFNQGPTLQSAPLGIPAEIPSASYDGVQGIQPVGSPVEKFNPKGEEAQKLLEMFKNSIFNTQA